MASTISQIPPENDPSKKESVTLAKWTENDISSMIDDLVKDGELFSFLEGPPFVSSSNLHFGHLLVSYIKSCFKNYSNMQGKNFKNMFGEDCHGLPIESLANKLLNLQTRKQVLEYGVDRYNAECKKLIQNFSGAWGKIYNRIGRIGDQKNQYKTLNTTYMESVWWTFKQLWDKGLVYKGFKIMPYSTGCTTPLSNFEASGDDIYKEVKDITVITKFKLVDENAYMLAWTTTPWTLPSNYALCLHPNYLYAKVKDVQTGNIYYALEIQLNQIYGVTKKTKQLPYEILSTHKGSEFLGRRYEPLFPYYKGFNNNIFQVVVDEYVQEDSGTGIVHIAPSFGDEDFKICLDRNIVTISEIGELCPIDDNGLYTSRVTDYAGQYVFDANLKIVIQLKTDGKVFKQEAYTHKYPFCWRTDTPLIYKAVHSFFIKASSLREKMVENNKKTTWIPENIGKVNFHNWLQNAKDWCVSRSRFFGTPLPIWVSDDGEEMVCVGSIDELMKLVGLNEKDRPTDLHLDSIQHIQIPSQKGKGMLKLEGSTLDCWFESGCAPYGQLHYPFENSDAFDNVDYLSDFVCEGVDQTRGWFYTLTVLATALFDKPAFKTVICSGLILAEDGKKFSKRLNNFVDPLKVLEKYGSDALRMYLVSSPASHAQSFEFRDEDIGNVTKRYIMLFNAFKFFLEHVTYFEKNKGKFNPDYYQKGNYIMDTWILARVNSVIEQISTSMNKYEIFNVYPVVSVFIEDLNNWYIKLNRNRIRGRFTEEDEQHIALSVLYNVLYTFIEALTPFAPFMCDYMFEYLMKFRNDDTMSVLLKKYPVPDPKYKNEKIIESMKNLQTITGMVSNLRFSCNLNAKTPIKNVIIAHNDSTFLEDIRTLESYLKEEIGSLNIEYTSQEGLIVYTVEPKNKEIGSYFKKEATVVKKLIKENEKYILENKDEEQFKIGDFIINQSMINIRPQLISNDSDMIKSKIENNIIVIANFTQDETTKKLHNKRLFIRAIQNMRKNSELKPWNKIYIYYQTEDQKFIDMVKEFNDTLVHELLYPVFNDEYPKDKKLVKEDKHDINGAVVKIAIVYQ